ncbi:hypothetical protein PHLGIDRAFT_113416 [Phlebiopsis gigantea 11061_1 CR5-6]|uniref:Uncharacterized protein n=1 Tax=Phlebiopsis gigantea (strain 11061_1 CR5-6) TaxID=745531 RepID=A0A0C3SEL1_PHLG1|nr:hypothetical protein PHLGIDRAFT_113416 [Phlebiopsis gigantea 11061_1 CR5-6]
MTTLPSFVELMASLGLESNSSDGKEDRPSYHGHSRSSSYSSTISTLSQSSGSSVEPNSDYDMDGPPYIVVSSSNQTVPRDVEVDRRKHRVRYSPYMPAISHIRRSSLPSAIPDNLHSHPPRALSNSPRSSSPLRGLKHPPSTSGLSRRLDKKLTLDADLIANTPISTFVRLRSPQSSPISPTFPNRPKRRSTSPSVPVSIPTLPTFCFPPLPADAAPLSSDTDDDIPSDASSTRRQRKRRARAVRQTASHDALGELAEVSCRARDTESRLA